MSEIKIVPIYSKLEQGPIHPQTRCEAIVDLDEKLADYAKTEAVNTKDANVLSEAKTYADTEIQKVNADLTEKITIISEAEDKNQTDIFKLERDLTAEIARATAKEDTKQDVIDDLDEIRANASSAVQPSTLDTRLAAYPTTEQVDTKLDSYVKVAALSEAVQAQTADIYKNHVTADGSGKMTLNLCGEAIEINVADTTTFATDEELSIVEDELNKVIANKQNKLSAENAGENITISTDKTTGKVTISSTGGTGGKTYASGNGITVDNTNDTIAIDETVTATKTDLAGKVDKEDGKGLSTKDYTEAEQTKLAGVAEGAQVNVIETIKVNGTELVPAEKAVDITISAQAEYSIKKDSSSGEFVAVYHLTKDGVNAGEAINIPKDLVVKSGKIVDHEIEGETVKCIELTLNNEAEDKIYISVKDLVDVYVGDNETIEVSDSNVISVKDGKFEDKGAAESATASLKGELEQGNITVGKATNSDKAAEATKLGTGTTSLTYEQLLAKLEDLQEQIDNLKPKANVTATTDDGDVVTTSTETGDEVIIQCY